MKKYLWTILVLLCTFSSVSYAQEPWKLVKEADGIEVYIRSVPGSAIAEFKGVGDVDAPVEVVGEIFKDIPSYTQWYGFCKEIKLLKQDSEYHRLIYFVLKTLGPVKDRDFIVDTNYSVDRQTGKLSIALHAIREEIVPRKSKYVRMTDLNGYFEIRSIDKNKTHVTYMIKADPAGYIPTFFLNSIQKYQPYLTIKGLREMVKREVYYKRAGVVGKNCPESPAFASAIVP